MSVYSGGGIRDTTDPRVPRVLIAGVVSADPDPKKIIVTLSGDPDESVSIFKTNNFSAVEGESVLVLAQGQRMVAVGLISDTGATIEGGGSSGGTSEIFIGPDEPTDPEFTGLWFDTDATNELYLEQAQNLADLDNKATARGNLGITVATSPPSSPAVNDVWIEVI